MACINKGKPLSPRIKFKAVQKIREQEYVSDQAYLIPENDGTAIYLSYDLNKALENVFNAYSISGFMGVSEFSKMCIDHNILPKNTNKDIIGYIFKVGDTSDTGHVNFKGFFQVLQRLSSYAFRKLIMTEQEKFNVLIKHLTIMKENKEQLLLKFNVGIQVCANHRDIGVNTTYERVDAQCQATKQMENKECMTDPIIVIEEKEETKETKESEEKDLASTKEKDPTNTKEYKSVETITSRSNLAKLKSRSTEDIEIRKKVQEVEEQCNNAKELNEKLKEELDNALTIIHNKNTELESLHVEMDELLETKKKELEELNYEIQKLQDAQKNLEEKQLHLVNNLDAKEKEEIEKQEHSKKIDADLLQLKRMLILFGEEEGEMFKIFFKFSIYDANKAEYTMDKKQCAIFLATYYILRKKESHKIPFNLTSENAATLFKETITEMNKIEKNDPPRTSLNYFYFKLLLSKIGKFLYPDLTERLSYLEIVSKHILFVHAHEKFFKDLGIEIKNEKHLKKLISKSQSIEKDNSYDFDTFQVNINGGYVSSSDGEKDVLSRFHLIKPSKKKINMMNEKRNDISIIKKEPDSSFEYIASNEVNRLKKLAHQQKFPTNNIHMKKRYDHYTKIKPNSEHITNYINKDIKYNKKYGYDTSSDDNSYGSILQIENKNMTSSRKKNRKDLKTYKKNEKHANVIPSTELLNRSKLIHFAEDAVYPNDFLKYNYVLKNDTKKSVLKNKAPLYDLEGTIWSPKKSQQDEFLAKFGNK